MISIMLPLCRPFFGRADEEGLLGLSGVGTGLNYNLQTQHRLYQATIATVSSAAMAT